jgi:hypothetical protein
MIAHIDYTKERQGREIMAWALIVEGKNETVE